MINTVAMKTFAQEMEATLVESIKQIIAEDAVKPSGSTHKTLTSHGWNHVDSDGKPQGGGKMVKIHRYEHPDHGHMTTIHGEGPTEWFYHSHANKQTTHNGQVKHLDPFVKGLQTLHDKKKAKS